jgi:hypothetical protein
MVKTDKITNPFYALLIPVGIAFVISASAYGVMAFRDTSRSAAGEPKEQVGLLGFMDRHGGLMLGIEVLLLGVLTTAAIGIDEIKIHRSASAAKDDGRPGGGTDQKIEKNLREATR